MNYSNENTRYDESYYINNNLPNKKKNSNIYVYIGIILILFLIVTSIYFLFFKVDEKVETANTEFIIDICETALQYASIKDNIIDEDIGSLAYIKIQDLIDENLLSNEQMINPGYKRNIFGYSKYDQYLSTKLYVILAVGDDGSLFCEGITDKNK